MLVALRVPWAFFLRDLRTELSYKLALLMRVLAAVLSVTVFHFIATALRGVGSTSFDEFGGYFPFAVVGLAFLTYMSFGIGAMASSMRDSQGAGTLELLVVSPTRLSLTLVSSALSGLVFAALTAITFLIAGAAFGVDFGDANVPAALVAFALISVSFLPLALLAASVVFLTTRGNPVAFGVRTASVVLCGVFYPVAVLPQWLEALSELLPLTHALELMRGTLLLGQGLGDLWEQVLALVVLTVALMALALVACALAVRVARTDGSLTR